MVSWEKIKIIHEITAPLHYYQSALSRGGSSMNQVFSDEKDSESIQSAFDPQRKPLIPWERDTSTFTRDTPKSGPSGTVMHVDTAQFWNTHFTVLMMPPLGFCSEQPYVAALQLPGHKPLWSTDKKCPPTQLLPVMSTDSDTCPTTISSSLTLVKHFWEQHSQPSEVLTDNAVRLSSSLSTFKTCLLITSIH